MVIKTQECLPYGQSTSVVDEGQYLSFLKDRTVRWGDGG